LHENAWKRTRADRGDGEKNGVKRTDRSGRDPVNGSLDHVIGVRIPASQPISNSQSITYIEPAIRRTPCLCSHYRVSIVVSSTSRNLLANDHACHIGPQGEMRLERDTPTVERTSSPPSIRTGMPYPFPARPRGHISACRCQSMAVMMRVLGRYKRGVIGGRVESCSEVHGFAFLRLCPPAIFSRPIAAATCALL
jgi:hypothetical protein